MELARLLNRIERSPIIAAIREDGFDAALASSVEVLFYLSADLLTVRSRIEQAHRAGKCILIHLDLAEGIGRDRTGIRFLAECGADGIISTRAQLIRLAKEAGLTAVQRFFALDSQGMGSMEEMLRSANPHLMEIMPGVITKAISRFAGGTVPVIAGGLIETKGEVTAALKAGAMAVSTGKKELWEL